MKIVCMPHVYIKASRPFPKLMVSENGRIIWAFGTSGALSLDGVLIRPANPESRTYEYDQHIGFYSKDWHASSFTDWFGTVTLVEDQNN